MSLLRRSVEALGADYRQWRSLTATMFKVEMRTATPIQLGDQRQRDGVGWSFVLAHGLTGTIAALAMAIVPGLFPGALVVISIVMLFLASSLLTDYQAAVASPDDFDVLGYQPISSRTYFLSRLTNLLVYAGMIGLLTGGPSLLVVLVRHGLLASVGLLAALATAIVWVVLVITTGYTALLHLVAPDRLRRGLSYLQLAMATIVYGSMFLLPLASRAVESVSIEPGPWLLLFPPAWFASLPRIATGSVGLVDGLAFLVLVGSTTMLAWVARGRLSLAYAERLGALFSVTTPAKRQRRPPWLARWFLARGPAELRVMGTLIRAQFRHDMRFRMVVLSTFPLGLCMLGVPLIWEATSAADQPALDPVVAMGVVHMSTIVLPVNLLDNLRYSESFRASWVFFSTPVDPAKLTVQAVNCASLFFLLPYLALVATALSWLFEDPARGIAHTFLLGLATVTTLHLAVLALPLVPFSEAPRKDTSARQITFMVVASLIGFAVLPPAIAFATSRTSVFAIASVVLVAACGLLPRILASRIRQRVKRIDFTG